ncbi:hypothetical protein [Anabaena catenula]|uniref:Transketolase n=1 Tax=Anabaena catenula FACHB-362 TaxID=2692877 RepID=A0ABR8J378_9NOST|nr:hypothetical protein [Anabaena catenula]MBD2692055.1 hypothetical protein [Anabaena catenula FACHB-362]
MSLQTSRGKLSVSTTPRRRKINYVLPVFLLVILLTSVSTVSAHKVQIAADIGGTLHIEPNDNPRAGEPSQAWFALTRKGGKVLPLKECDCQLAVYAEPYTPGEPALLEPALQPVQAERYEGIPGAEITFPKPGAYELKLTGKPATEGSFRPFDLKFQITVAAGKAVETPQAVENITNQQQGGTIGFIQPIIVIAIILLSIGIVFFLVQALRR